jgi:predicted amidophosphoribosyltransferase
MKEDKMYKLVCRHCKTEFTKHAPQAFCDNCWKKIYEDGTIRRCDHCGHTWEVVEGEAGHAYFAENPERTLELCDNCAERFGVE